AEANEGAIKIARKYHYTKGNKGRYRMIVTTGSFHGRTMMTVAAGDSEQARKGFDPLPDGFDRVAFGNLNELRAAVGPETAGILVEPITGEGGIRAASPEYLQGLRKVADEFDLILCYDEIQCGMGRTGKLFAHEWSGAAPDVMTLAKGIGGGFPMAAILANERAAAPLVAGSHGTTFGGNPLAMACGNAVLDVMLAPGFLARVEKTGTYLRQKLGAVVAKHPTVLAELRGAGLMLGLKCVVPAGEMMDRLREAGLLTVSANDNVVRILPPLIVGEAECDQAVAIVDKVAAAWPAAKSAGKSAA
ncbi:MAG: acetylornithine transaminase, partial [Alphaproteobacteria bacterium]|nr:acetylornithine transaminase [Alphaproteobacteria bacterium]